MARRNVETLFPDQPLSLPIPHVPEPMRVALGETFMQLVDINLGNRAGLDYALDYWNAMYEMRTKPRNVPWPNAANYCLPVVYSAVQEMKSRIVGTVLTPRPITIRGNDPVSSQYAHLVEQFMNGECDLRKWPSQLEECISLGVRDGTAIAEVLWKLSTRQEYRLDRQPLYGPDGQAVMSDDGRQQAPTVRKLVNITEYDAPWIEPCELRDFLLIPNFAPSIAAADAVARKVYMNSADMFKMQNAGIFFKDAVESVLAQGQTGMGELSKDRQGARTYTISGRIVIADTGVAPPTGMTMLSGPYEIWRGLTRQFDLDGDGVPEDNFIWVHDQSRKLLGVAPFQYWRGWPYFPYSPMPRPRRFYGFSVPELVRFAQEEGNAQHNGRLDLLDYGLSPMRYRTRDVRYADEDKRWGMDSEVIVTKKDDFGFVDAPTIPPFSAQDEQMLMGYADKATGAPQAAAMQLPSGARRSAREAQAQAAIQAMQSNSVIKVTRDWMLEIFSYAYGLYLQYGDDQMEAVMRSQEGMAHSIPVPKEVFGLNYTIGVAGTGGPFDKEQRRNDAMMLTQFLSTTPMVQGNLPRTWNLARMVLETFDIPEVTSLIGTMDDAVAQGQAQAAAAQQQQQMGMLMQILSHANFGKPGAKGSPGAAAAAVPPPGGGQPPPQPGAPGGP